ncbi:hypothetical protein CIK99_00280 [Prevotella sp. P5-92]|uniref:Outer membrane protein SusF domain-containing protein n=1 Tax=Prevotella sp. P5-92 TaxID=2024222 RepID=UPI000B96540D|nr:DUF5115 domain-containing protein [Prevotella sp. P5-92]OYP60052.1 hypothetical protein CIK99_00280 [Prevotella sp. P5-92]
MKKSLIYGMVLATALMSSCKGDYDDWAAPQGYDAEEAQNVSLTASDGATIDMNNVTGETINLFSTTFEAPEGFTVTGYELEVGATEEEVDVLPSDANGSIATADLVSLVESIYGKAPVERTLKAASTIYLSKDGESFYAHSNFVDVKVTLITPDISQNYYLVGDFCGWDEASMLKFSHSDVNIYDDPVFTIKFTTTEANQYWKIIPQKNIDNGEFWANPGVVGVAVDGDASMSGFLVTENAQAGKIEEPGKYIMTIDMMAGTYSITKQPLELYMTGSNYGWGATWLPMTPCYGSDEDFWTIIYLHEGEQFKFAPQAGWGDDFGGQATVNDVAGANITVDGTNLVAGKAGWYLLYIHNGSERTFTVLQPNVYLIGDTAGEWNVADSHKFTIPTTEDGVFESPAFANDAELRMCVSIEGFDWWKTEFIILGGDIAYRGRGGDQERVAVKVGQKAYLNFAKGTGEIK